MNEASYEQILKVLVDADVEFILIGGLAAMAMGSSRATFDIDVVYERSAGNFRKLATCLAAYQPYLRGAPAGLPFRLDVETIRRGLNFTLTTSIGALDLFGEVAGGGSYGELLTNSETIEIFHVPCRCVTLQKLIELKRAAGRPKDLEAIAELELLLDNQGVDE